jgi:hypothetical protein
MIGSRPQQAALTPATHTPRTKGTRHTIEAMACGPNHDRIEAACEGCEDYDRREMQPLRPDN